MITYDEARDRAIKHGWASVKPQVATIGNRFCCVGTDYGWIHTTGGDVRTWGSYSGARRFLNKYLEYRKW